MRFSPETNPIIEAHEPAASNAIAATCDPIYLGNAVGVWIIVHEDFAVDANHLVMTLREGATSAIALAGSYTRPLRMGMPVISLMCSISLMGLGISRRHRQRQ